MFKLFVYICVILILANCSSKTKYSGKILNQDDLKDINFSSKEKLISKLGSPSYIDTVQNKFFYFTEKSEKRSVFKKNIKFSYIFVFELDDNNMIITSKVYNIKDIENIKFSKDKISNEIVKRGLLEKIFGGVGAQQELPTTPWIYNDIAASNNNATMFVILIIGFTAGPAVSL